MGSVETSFLPLPMGIVLQSVHLSEITVVVQVACQHPSAACPQCGQPSARVHGRYIRTVADLPCGGRVLLKLVVRKFVCPTLNCPQQLFTERRSEFVQPYARMTNRLREALRRMSPTRASWLLFLPTERLTDRQRQQRERVRACHPEVETAYQLVSAFVRMLAERREQGLECWLGQATHSQLPELKGFARGMRRDEAAVRAAFSSGISNGQTEGQVNRLKVLKRSMYGHANFDLLRLRFLYRA